MAEKLSIKTVQKISEVERADWDRLLGEGSPFMKWDWLDALERLLGSGMDIQTIVAKSWFATML